MSTDQSTPHAPQENGKPAEDPYMAELVQIRTRVTRISIKATAMRHTLYYIAVVITIVGALHLILK
jgi:hypothetical protein